LEIEQITASETAEMNRRERAYRSDRQPLKIEGLTVILVDDGIATGSSIRAAISALRQMKPARLVVATPVASLSARDRLRLQADDVICVIAPEGFYGIGQFYEDFSQTGDEEVVDLLHRAEQTRKQQENDRARILR
jgi:predicted phosphoribosyltransferase